MARLRISEACPLILPYHIALDQAREKARGEQAIGTTGRGIGPAYEDKVARRAVRLGDLFHRERFAAKLGEVLDFHNFVLQRYFQTEPVDFQQVLDETLTMAERLRPLAADVTALLDAHRRRGDNVLFEGAQGAMLDIDHGTYPYVTSSNTTAGGAATGTGLGPRYLDYVLGITKAYTTRVGGGPFPTELFDRDRRLSDRTRPRVRFDHRPAAALRLVRCDGAAPLHREQQRFGVVRDQAGRAGWTGPHPDVHRLSVRVGTAGQRAPAGAEALAACAPIYEEMPGWREPTAGVRRHEDLPAAARAYLRRIEELAGVPIDLISTSPDRDDTIVLRDPFAASKG